MKFFKSKHEKEVERRIQSRQGERKARRHIDSQRKQVQRYWELAKKAYVLGDRDILQHLVTLIHSTRQDISNWERRCLYFRMLEAQRDQVVASAEFAKAFDSLAATIFASADPAELTRMQANLERSLLVAEELEDRVLDFQSSLDDLLSDSSVENQTEYVEILDLIKEEAKQEAVSDIDLEINNTLTQINELLGRSEVE